MVTTIQALKKIQLQVSIDKAAGSEPTPCVFIYGLAKDGLSPLETALCGKKEGDTFSISVPSESFQEFLGPCLPGIPKLPEQTILPMTIDLNIIIISVQEAKSLEIVKSLAKSSAHGSCGGACDCGCC